MRLSLKTILAATTIIFLLAVSAPAQAMHFGLSAGADSLAAEVGFENSYEDTTLYSSVSALYMEDDFSLGNLKVGLQQSLLDPALTIGLGFNGVGGEVEKNQRDFDVAALAFAVNCDYDLAKTPANIPATIFGSISLAHDPLSFSDAERYVEAAGGVKLALLNNGALTAKYVRIEFDLDDSGFKTDKKENLFFIGLELSLGGY